MSANRLVLGDNLVLMKQLESESIDLIYFDPPFYSGKHYNSDGKRAFSDVWKNGLEEYLKWLNSRLIEAKRLLKPSGSLYVHLDWHAVHYVKVEMDKIFGYDNFVNEIIWSYRTGGVTKRYFGRKHDTILLYQVSDKRKFNVIPEKSVQSHHYGYKNVPYYIDEETGKQYRYAQPRDVWEITLGTGTNERNGYPTQKPEGLLEKIILASSDEGDLVADFCCGSGTTPAVAQRLNRRFLACDHSPQALQITQNRLKTHGAEMSFKTI